MGYNKESVDGIYLERASFAEIQAAGPGAFAWTYAAEARDIDVKHESVEEGDDGPYMAQNTEQIKSRIIGMIHYLPGAGFGHLNIKPYNGTGAAWDWDGNIEKPTLTPSIKAMPAEPHGDYPGRVGWHGHLKAGRWESCP